MRSQFFLWIGILGALFQTCQQSNYVPKPRGYHRIEFPDRQYQSISKDDCSYTFEIPHYSQLIQDHSRHAKPCWKNLDFPQFNARLHLSYYSINSEVTLAQLSEDARKFAFTHTTKATSIDQQQINLPGSDVYGLEYSIQGNTASNYQFYITDSSRHYLRGALYFNEKPNLDSIQPVLEFLKEDIQYLISTVKWQ